MAEDSGDGSCESEEEEEDLSPVISGESSEDLMMDLKKSLLEKLSLPEQQLAYLAG